MKKSVKKLLQENENDLVVERYNQDFHENYLTGCTFETTRLYHCSAKVEVKLNYIHLISYGTLIATYEIQNNSLYDYLRFVYGYTATSSQHISKFYRWLKENGYNVNKFYRWYAL